MNAIAINVIAVNGVLIGVTASDRWNLASLGLTGMRDDRNGSALKKARRYLAKSFGTDFTISKARNVRALSLPTLLETEALGISIGVAA